MSLPGPWDPWEAPQPAPPSTEAPVGLRVAWVLGPSCPFGAWRVHLGLPAPGSQSLMVLTHCDDFLGLEEREGEGMAAVGLQRCRTPRNPQGEPLGVTIPKLLSLGSGDTHPSLGEGL